MSGDPFADIRAQVAANGADQSGASRAGAAIVRVLADVTAKSTEWLWYRRIVAGGLTMVGGDPGVGKSYFTLDAAARVTTGTPWPDGERCPGPADVILLTGEDDLERTIRPRLDAHRADVRRVHYLAGMRTENGGERLPSLSSALDVHALEALITRTQAALVIVDPINMYLDSRLDTRTGNGVRSVTTPLASIAQRTGAAVVVVMHLNKATLQGALYRMSGSVDWVAAARVVLAIGFDPTREDRRRLLLPMKCNLSAEPDGLGYTISPEGELHWDHEPVTVDVQAMLRGMAGDTETGGRGQKQGQAATFLLKFLAAGPRLANEVYAAAQAAGIADRTLERAKGEVPVDCFRKVPTGPWYWRLPAPPDPDGPGRHDLPDLAEWRPGDLATWETANGVGVAPILGGRPGGYGPESAARSPHRHIARSHMLGAVGDVAGWRSWLGGAA
jgi:hypothetical protein